MNKNNKCKICNKEVEVNNLCNKCYSEVTTYYKKGFVSNKEIKEFKKLKEQVQIKMNNNNLLVRKAAKFYDKDTYEVLKEIIKLENDYCNSEFKKDRSTIDLNTYFKLLNNFPNVLWSVLKEPTKSDLNSVLVDNTNGGRVKDEIESFYKPINDWL